MKKKQENSRNTILECALELFAQKGYDGVGVSEITEAAGITKPTLYYFFHSKEGLFQELLQEHYGIFLERVRAGCVYEPDPANYHNDVHAVLLRLADVYFQFAREYPRFYMMSLSLTFAPSTSASAVMAVPYHKKEYGIVEELFRHFSAVHHNLKGKEKEYSWRFLSMINAQVGVWNWGYAEITKEDSKSLVNQFMHGIFS